METRALLYIIFGVLIFSCDHAKSDENPEHKKKHEGKPHLPKTAGTSSLKKEQNTAPIHDVDFFSENMKSLRKKVLFTRTEKGNIALFPPLVIHSYDSWGFYKARYNQLQASNEIVLVPLKIRKELFNPLVLHQSRAITLNGRLLGADVRGMKQRKAVATLHRVSGSITTIFLDEEQLCMKKVIHHINSISTPILLNISRGPSGTENHSCLKQLRSPQLYLALPYFTTDNTLENLKTVRNIKGIYMRHGKLTPKGISILARLPRLKLLSMERTPLYDSHIKALKHAKNLRELSVPDSTLTDYGLAHISSLKELTSLTLGNRPCTEPRCYTEFVLAAKKNGHKGVHLPLSLNYTKNGLRQLKSLNKLKHFDFNRTLFRYDLMAFLRNFPGLERIELHNEHAITENIEQLRMFPNLRDLRLVLVTDAGILKPLVKLKNLTHLQLEGFMPACDCDNPATLFPLQDLDRLPELKKLRSLTVSALLSTAKIDEENDTYRFLKGMKNLEHLRIGSGSAKIAYLPNPKKLKSLSIPDTPYLEKEELAFLRSASSLNTIVFGQAMADRYGPCKADSSSCSMPEQRKNSSLLLKAIEHVKDVHCDFSLTIPDPPPSLKMKAIRFTGNLPSSLASQTGDPHGLSILLKLFNYVKHLKISITANDIAKFPPAWPPSLTHMDLFSEQISPAMGTFLSSVHRHGIGIRWDTHLWFDKKKSGSWFIQLPSWTILTGHALTSLRERNRQLVTSFELSSNTGNFKDLGGHIIKEHYDTRWHYLALKKMNYMISENSRLLYHRQAQATHIPLAVYKVFRDMGLQNFRGAVMEGAALKTLLSTPSMRTLRVVGKKALPPQSGPFRATHLTHLELETSIRLKQLISFPELKKLSISVLPGTEKVDLSSLRSLTHVTLRASLISTKTIESLGTLPNLTSLTFESCYLPKNGFKYVAAIGSLKHLKLTMFDRKGRPVEPPLLPTPQNKTYKITDTWLRELSDTKLHSLHLETDWVTPKGVDYLPSTLRSITLLGSTNNDKILNKIIKRPLIHLGISCRDITQESFIKINTIPSLKSLALHDFISFSNNFSLLDQLSNVSIQTSNEFLTEELERLVKVKNLKTFSIIRHRSDSFGPHPRDFMLLARIERRVKEFQISLKPHMSSQKEP